MSAPNGSGGIGSCPSRVDGPHGAGCMVSTFHGWFGMVSICILGGGISEVGGMASASSKSTGIGPATARVDGMASAPVRVHKPEPLSLK